MAALGTRSGTWPVWSVGQVDAKFLAGAGFGRSYVFYSAGAWNGQQRGSCADQGLGRSWVLARPRVCASQSFGLAGVRFFFRPEGSIGLFSLDTHLGVSLCSLWCRNLVSRIVLLCFHTTF